MFFVHKHSMQLVARTYAPPRTGSIEGVGFIEEPTLERLIHGCTTFVWKCSDPSCTKVKTVTVLGAEKEVRPSLNVVTGGKR